jgi:hypothetical protein
MTNPQQNLADLMKQFGSLIVQPDRRSAITLHAEDVRGIDWGKCLLIRVLSNRLTNYQILTEALHKSWHNMGLKDLTRFDEKNYIAEFHIREGGGAEGIDFGKRVMALQTRFAGHETIV